MPQIPIPENESERLAALASYQILDTLPEQDFQELTQLASEICHTPIALISLVDDTRQWFKSKVGLEARQTPKEYAFCAHTIINVNEVMIVNDARKDARFADNPLVNGSPNVVFYAGAPLVNEDGYPLGSLCVIDHEPKELTQRQIQSLRILAKQVLTQLELRRKLAALEKANEVLLEANTFIQKFASTAAHDIKNPLSSIMLTAQALQMRMEQAGDEKSRKLAELNMTSTKKLLTFVDEMLAYSKTPALLLRDKQDLELSDMLQRVVSMIKVPDNVNIVLPGIKHTLTCSSVALEQIFLNLLSNAVRYNDKEQCIIRILFREEKDRYAFKIEDNGIGISQTHLEKIFEKDFTLGITDRFDQKGTGIGLSTVKALIEKLGGKINVESTVGEGATFHFSISKNN
jgi:signal transduction histidine kinase